MPTYSFSLVVDGLAVDDPNHDSFLAAVGADDVMLFESDGTTYAAFYRDAVSATHAVRSAISSIRDAYPLARVLDLDLDLVSVADIADRTGSARETIRLYVNGARGPGNFPNPMGVVGAGHAVWEWAAVFDWLVDQIGHAPDDGARPVPVQDAIQLRADICCGHSRRSVTSSQR